MASTATAGSSPALSGWFDAARADAPSRPIQHREPDGRVRIEAPGLQVSLDPRRVLYEIGESTLTLCFGAPRIGARAGGTPAREVAEEIHRRGDADWGWLHGRFALVHIDLRTRVASLVTDRFAVHPICYSIRERAISFSDRADGVEAGRPSELDPQAIYNYVYFHVIPSPRTIFRGIVRLEPAQALRFDSSGGTASFWWSPAFEPESRTELAVLKSRFLDLIHQAVERESEAGRTGSFLSGGTDSSTVAGVLSKLAGRGVPTFSIGFDASGYDEMSYARIAARHFGTEQHEYYITPDDLVRSISEVAAHYDQPFGNSSALPAYYCAARARQAGIEKLLAGDGGDELFGGNLRYAKQKVFALYGAVPGMLRAGLIEPILVRQKWPRSVPLLKKAASYVEQARIDMPDRLETYNLLDRFGRDAVFTPNFLMQIEAGEPRSLQRQVYQRQQAGSMVDRMLAYDWRFTLADNDLPKVTGTCELAAQRVGFPLLDDDLVDFSLRLAPDLKVRGLTLRFFFKEALRGFLPDEIIRKSKHGFGLPFGPWLVQHEPLRALARGALHRMVARGIVRGDMVHELFSVRLRQHAGYFGEMIWILMMLEHWLQAKAPGYAV